MNQKRNIKKKDKALVDATNKSTLTKQEKKKISDNAVEKIGFLQKDIKDLTKI